MQRAYYLVTNENSFYFSERGFVQKKIEATKLTDSRVSEMLCEIRNAGWNITPIKQPH